MTSQHHAGVVTITLLCGALVHTNGHSHAYTHTRLFDDHYPHPLGRFKAITNISTNGGKTPIGPLTLDLMPRPAAADYDGDDHWVIRLEMMHNA